LHIRVLFAWAMKFNRKYCRSYLYITPNRRQSASCRVFFEEGGGDAQEQVRLVFLAQLARSARKASEICLQASEKTVVESLTGLVVNSGLVVLFQNKNRGLHFVAHCLWSTLMKFIEIIVS